MDDKKRLQKYGRIIKYIEDCHSELYEVIDNLGLYNSFTPRKGCGVTFILPHTAFLSKLTEETYGPNPDKAIDSLKSLILLVTLKDTSDWDKMRDDIPNLLGQKLKVKKISKNGVMLENGAILELDPKFQTMESRQNMAVWKLREGEIPLDGPASDYKYVKSMRKTKNSKPEESNEDRVVYARNIEHASEREGQVVYLREMASLLHHLKNHRRDLFDMCQSILDPSPRISFYLLLEPYYKGEDPLISKSVLDKWNLKPHPHFPESAAFWKKVFNNLDSRHSDALIYSINGRKQIRMAVSKVRDALARAANPKAKLERINAIYNEIESKNTIAGYGPIYPPNVSQIYKNRPGFKEWQDNSRLLLRLYFEKYDGMELELKLAEFSGEDFSRESIITGNYEARRMSSTIASLIDQFIDSDLIFYTPRIHAEWNIKEDDEDEEDEEFTNFAAREMGFLDSVRGGSGMSSEALEDHLRLLRQMDPEGYKQLLIKFQEAKSAKSARSAENSEAEESR
jgi:hypothetical protein